MKTGFGRAILEKFSINKILFKFLFLKNVCSFHQCHLNSVDTIHRYLHLKMGLPPALNAGSSGIMRT